MRTTEEIIRDNHPFPKQAIDELHEEACDEFELPSWWYDVDDDDDEQEDMEKSHLVVIEKAQPLFVVLGPETWYRSVRNNVVPHYALTELRNRFGISIDEAEKIMQEVNNAS